MIDLVLAAYKAKKGRLPAPPKGSQFVFNRPVIETARGERNKMHQLVKGLRQDTYKRKEHYDKQLGHILNKQRYAQHATWQAEFDRLKSFQASTGGPMDRAYAERLDELREALRPKGA